MTKPTENTINKILAWKEKNRLTEEDFENAGFNEIIEIIQSQEDDIELHLLERMQEYNCEHGYNDEAINDRIIELRKHYGKP